MQTEIEWKITKQMSALFQAKLGANFKDFNFKVIKES